MKKNSISGICFSLPAILYILLTLIGPLLIALYLSFTEFHFLYSHYPTFVGLRNYLRLFHDKQFITAVINTFYFSVVFFSFSLVFGLVIALFLATEIRGSKVFNTMIFLPVIVPLSLTAVAFVWILDPDFGILNYLLRSLGLRQLTRKWLSNPRFVIPSIIGVSLWRYLGVSVVMFLGGLHGIPRELSDSAKIDGASAVEELLYITLPNLKETLLIVSVWNIMVSFKVFTQVKVMTGGGPGTMSMVLYLYMYNNLYEYFRLGYASAISYFIAVVIVVFAYPYEKILKSERR